jgi:hypothetical protein
MALVVENGIGLSTAESYASVAEADMYHANFGNAGWTGTDTQKEVALRRATQYLDGTYKTRWGGYRKTRDQTLDWPRSFTADYEGFYIPVNAIPKSLKDATAEVALRALVTNLTPDLKRGGAVKRVKVGEIEQEFFGGASSTTTRPTITLILSRLLLPPNMFRQI